MSLFLQTYDVVNEGVIDKLKEGVKKLLHTIAEWVRKFIGVLQKIKRYLVEKVKSIMAKFKGKREVEITDTKKCQDAVNKAMDASKALANGDGSKVDDVVEALKDAKDSKVHTTITNGNQIIQHNTETTRITSNVKPCLDAVTKALEMDNNDPKKSEKLAKALTDTLKAMGEDEKTLGCFASFEAFDKAFSNNEPMEL